MLLKAISVNFFQPPIFWIHLVEALSRNINQGCWSYFGKSPLQEFRKNTFWILMKIFTSLNYGKGNPDTDYLVVLLNPDIFHLNFNYPWNNFKDLILDNRSNIKFVDNITSKLCSWNIRLTSTISLWIIWAKWKVFVRKILKKFL